MEAAARGKGVALESQAYCGDDGPLVDSRYFRAPDGHLIELIMPVCWEICLKAEGVMSSVPTA